MRPYEVMVIFDTGTEPPAIQAVVDRLLETVRTSGGTPGAVDRWGRRPFAYEVKHRREGYYVLVEFSGEVQTVNDLDRMLSLADEVLRHKVIRLPEKALRRVGSGTAGGKGTAAPPRHRRRCPSARRPRPPRRRRSPSPDGAGTCARTGAVADGSDEGAEVEVVAEVVVEEPAEAPAESDTPPAAEAVSDLAEA